MKTALVTGGTGFIGSAIVRALLVDSAVGRVVAYDNFSTGKTANIEDCLVDVEVVEADIRDRNALRESMRGVDWVFHDAAVASVSRSVAEPLETHEINVSGTLNVFSAARDAGVARVVFASSAAVYGDAESMPIAEDAPARPESPYGIHKLTGELYARGFFAADGLETVSLRYFNVYGPRQTADSQHSGVVAAFCRSVLNAHGPTIDGDGAQTRDLIFVDDVAYASVQAARSSAAAGKAYNIAGGQGVAVNDVWTSIKRVSGSDLEARTGPPRSGDIAHSTADITRARADLHFSPKVDLAQGLGTTLEWYRRSQG